MNGLLNETTRTVHRRENETPAVRAVCGATLHLDGEQLRETTVSDAVTDGDADKCGRCFDDGGGY